MARAASTRLISFEDCDYTRRWWLRVGLCLSQVEDDLTLKYVEYAGTGASSDSLDRYRAVLMPWTAADGLQTQDEQTQTLAAWYLTFAPDRVRHRG